MPCLLLAEQTTSDNLLTNSNFSNGLDDWTVEDSNKVKHDPACYGSGTDASGLCKSVRWKTDDGTTISQTIENLEQGYDIEGVNVSFTALGCNNEANSNTWCTQGTDYDKVQAVVKLYDQTNSENLVLEQILDYNDGTQDYSLTTTPLGDWVTDNTNIDFSITGIDTGDWAGWYAPIVDNISLNITISETVIEQNQNIEIQSLSETITTNNVVEETNEIVEETNNLIEGIDLETSVLNDVILDLPEIPELPELQIVEVAVVEEIAVIDELPDIAETIDIPETIDIETNDLPVVDDIDLVEDVEVIEDVVEIEEIEIEESVEQLEESIAEDSNVSESEEKIADTSSVSDQKQSTKKKENTKKTKKKEKKEKKVASNSQNKAKTKGKSTISTSKKTQSSVDIPVLFTLLTIQDSIKIENNIVIEQEFTYEQDTTAFSSNVAWDFINDSAYNSWRNLDSLKPVFTFRGYRNSGK